MSILGSVASCVGRVFRNLLPIVLVVAVSACGGPDVVETGGAFADALADGSAFAEGQDDDRPPVAGTGSIAVRSPAFLDVVGGDAELMRVSVAERAPAAPLWRRGRASVLYADSITGQVWVWSEGGGVELVRSDVFRPASDVPEDVVARVLAAEAIGVPLSDDDIGVVLASEAGVPLYLTADFDGSIFAFDGRAMSIVSVPAATGTAVAVWTAAVPDAWSRVSGFAFRPGVPDEAWFSAEGPSGLGLYSIEAAGGNAPWGAPRIVHALEGVAGFAFSADGSYVVVATRGEDEYRWLSIDPSEPGSQGVVVARLPVPEESADVEVDDTWSGVLVDLRGRIYAAAPDGIEVFSSTGERLGTVVTPVPVRALSWGYDGTWLFFAGIDGLYVLQLESAGAGVPPGIPSVFVSTTVGDFAISLEHGIAPVTTVNFLRYAHEGFYSGTIFHRVIEGFVVQGGGFDRYLQPYPVERDPIRNESDERLAPVRGAVAMARLRSPDSATTQFFVNVVDNRGRGLETGPSGPGYAVFGAVSSGLGVIDAISVAPVQVVRDHQFAPRIPVVINSLRVGG